MANVNEKETIIKLPKPTYYHCYKLDDSKYVLFDKKMDMPIVIGSISIIKTTKLPLNSTVFYYKLGAKGFFEKSAEKYIEINGDNKHIKPPLRYHYINQYNIFYHHFKLSTTLSSLFDENFKMPIMYGSNQKIQAVMNKINKSAIIFYYKEDITLKNSFKLWNIYKKS